jgi:phage portal protein BeeE
MRYDILSLQDTISDHLCLRGNFYFYFIHQPNRFICMIVLPKLGSSQAQAKLLNFLICDPNGIQA